MKLFALIIGHAFADFVFQTEWMAKYKNRRNQSPPPIGQKQQSVWFYVLTAHALVHGGIVWIITGNVWLGIAETVAHWCIDFGKCENWYGIHTDQSAHVICKILWSTL